MAKDVELSLPKGIMSPALTNLVNEMLDRDASRRPTAKSILSRPELVVQVRPLKQHHMNSASLSRRRGPSSRSPSSELASCSDV
mmetsp:Transcript_10890/g.22708  ORF Transcript_10890/g.22708 Transcript_10890/m.22708 type:complete len:84 (-) Transcript_10890:1421-1672(-)